MAWRVRISKRLQRKIEKLPVAVQEKLVFLVREIIFLGPIRGNWPNYSSLGGNRHHCHIKKGPPAYVGVWEVVDQEVRIVEVIYVGTHEKAPY
jgi:mRNA-degrading endonuclease RelE of RelBE toxin-antitoxin system